MSSSPRSLAIFPERSGYVPACAAVSLVLHLGAGLLLHRERSADAAPTRVPVELTMAKPAEPPPKPAPLPEPEPPPKPQLPQPAPKPIAAKASPKTESTPTPPTPEPPPQMTGRTLTDPGEDDASWASATGNGDAMTGPLVVNPAGAPTGKGTGGLGPAPVTTPPPPPTGPRFVALRDLARRPRAPNLDDALERHFPARARQQGLSGSAVLNAQILPDGRIGAVKRVSESSAGFAEACERTLRTSRWSPPLDRTGTPVATEITYTCRFEVRD